MINKTLINLGFLESRNTQDYLYVFMHIPKCAGSTIVGLIKEKYGKDAILQLDPNHTAQTEELIQSMSQKQRNSIKFIYGHQAYYGIHRLFDRETRYFTTLRNPVKRVISHYNYTRYYRPPLQQKMIGILQQDPTKDNKEVLLTFEEWIKQDSWVACNFMTRHLYDRRSHTTNREHNTEIVKKPVDRKALEEAKNLLKKFYFIGFVESSFDDMAFLANRLDLKFHNLKNINVKEKKLQATEITTQEKLILEKNTLDIELYNYAIELRKEQKLSHLKDYDKSIFYTKTVSSLRRSGLSLKRKAQPFKKLFRK